MINNISNMLLNKRILYSLLLIVLLIPTFFIHTQKYPDWGDDFAQYVYQSQQIHTPSLKYNKVLNIEEYSSSKRSVFFSVILSVIKPTLQIQNYVNVISISYIFAGLICFIFFSNYFTLSISFIASLAVSYNFLILRLKSEIVPEFIFMALFYGVLYLIYNNKKCVKYVIPILLGLLVSVRFVGLSLLLSYICFILFQKDKVIKDKLKTITITIVIFTMAISCINYFFLSNINNQEVKLYSSVIFQEYELNMFFGNISRYSHYILYFFEQEIPYWMNTIITFFAFTFFIIGFVISGIKQKNICHLAFVFYFLFLLCYPYNGDNIKYLIPIMPLVFYFMIFGLKAILELIKIKYSNIILVASLSIVFLSNSKTIWLAIKHNSANIGPYELSVLKDFEVIQQKVKITETIAFGKPFIINLLADRDAYFLSQKNYSQVFLKANYVLSAKPCVQELYPKIKDIPISRGDTTELTNFYLIKL